MQQLVLLESSYMVEILVKDATKHSYFREFDSFN